MKKPFEKDYYEAHVSKLQQPPEILEKLRKWIKSGENICYFAGNPGCGKTYFSAAYYNYLIDIREKKNKELNEKKPKDCKAQWFYKMDIRYFNERTLFSKLREFISEGCDWESSLYSICDENDYLILDDMGSSRLNEWQVDVIHTFIDIRNSNRKSTLITSNFFISELDEYFHPRVKSRICDKRNTIIEVNETDKRLERNSS